MHKTQLLPLDVWTGQSLMFDCHHRMVSFSKSALTLQERKRSCKTSSYAYFGLETDWYCKNSKIRQFEPTYPLPTKICQIVCSYIPSTNLVNKINATNLILVVLVNTLSCLGSLGSPKILSFINSVTLHNNTCGFAHLYKPQQRLPGLSTFGQALSLVGWETHAGIRRPQKPTLHPCHFGDSRAANSNGTSHTVLTSDSYRKSSKSSKFPIQEAAITES